MVEEKIKFIIQEKYIELVNKVIDELKALPLQNIQDNPDMPFDNVWEAFVCQLQEEVEDLSYPAYEHVIVNICQQITQTMTLTELKLLWLISGGYLKWDDDNEFPGIEQMIDEVAEELFSWVEQEAEDSEFEEDEYDDDEENEFDYQTDPNQTKH